MNVDELDLAELRAKLLEAVEMSNWYFDGSEWWLAEQWHLVAVELQAELDLRSRPQ